MGILRVWIDFHGPGIFRSTDSRLQPWRRVRHGGRVDRGATIARTGAGNFRASGYSPCNETADGEDLGMGVRQGLRLFGRVLGWLGLGLVGLFLVVLVLAWIGIHVPLSRIAPVIEPVVEHVHQVDALPPLRLRLWKRPPPWINSALTVPTLTCK